MTHGTKHSTSFGKRGEASENNATTHPPAIAFSRIFHAFFMQLRMHWVKQSVQKCALGKMQTKTAGASPHRLWEFLLPGISRPASKAQPTGLVFVA
ncbi:MAG: hypothetical protein MJE68_24665 [Proteobacteria bacterium]|nr:hypothetical protein [Pseudomonadota bacterium]